MQRHHVAHTTFAAGILLALIGLAGGCAGTRETTRPQPPREAPALRPDAREQVPGEGDEGYTLPDVSGEPGIAALTARLGEAAGSERPSLLLRRALESIGRAQSLRRERMKAFHVFGFEDELHFVSYYDLAARDCREILHRHPQASQAPEAQFTLGLINDYPHLTRFEEADAAYRITMERYPGTEAARKAETRLRRLKELLGGPMPLPGAAAP